MPSRPYKMLWLIIAVAMTMQAIAPSIALAQVSVRCVGASAAAEPCAKAVLALDSAAPEQFKCADMSCCRSKAKLMRACNMAMNSMQSTSPFVSATSTPRCLISITPIGSSQPANKVILNRWLVTTSPALGPPSEMTTDVSRAISISFPRPRPNHLSTSIFTRSHALRAPPVA